MPSAASIASTRPAATTAHCPASKLDSASMRRRAERDVGFIVRRRRARAERTERRGQPRRDIVRADDADSLALDDRGQADEEPIVAATEQLRQPRRPLHRPPVEPEIGEFGSRHRADDHHLGDGARVQGREQLADFAHAHPDVRVGFDRRIGRAHNADEKRLPASAARLCGDLERKRARAAEDRQRRP